jgi:hypothetical protein
MSGGAPESGIGAAETMRRLRERRPVPGEYAPYYAGYVERVPGGDVVATLQDQHVATVALLSGLDEETERHRYAPEKWSVRECVAHVVDTERVFSTRLLWFARGHDGPLPGMDQDAWVAIDTADERPLLHQLAEWRAVRSALVALLEGLDAAAWSRDGVASEVRFTVPALAWVVAGHELHHRQLFRDRYGLGGGG